MNKLLKKPEIFLIAVGLLLFACALYVSYFPLSVPDSNRVIYVSAKDKEVLLEKSTPESVIINLNTATLEQLCQLEGIDKVTAQAIIDYRTEKGRFESFDELLDIEGIGDVKYRSIKTYTTLE